MLRMPGAPRRGDLANLATYVKARAKGCMDSGAGDYPCHPDSAKASRTTPGTAIAPAPDFYYDFLVAINKKFTCFKKIQMLALSRKI